MNPSSSYNPYSFNKPNIDHDEWVQSIRKSIVEIDDEQIAKIPVSIVTVPQLLLATKPEAYIPQQVALGPFHQWRPEVYEMQRYKLAAARRTQKYMNISFDRLVEFMKTKGEARIRACYHKFIDMSSDALVWMMAVDMAFLLECLVVYSMKEEGGTVNELVTSAMSHLVDVTGQKLSHMLILRDLVMVENQIPLFLIKAMLEHRYSWDGEDNSAEETLKTMIIGLYHELSPFQEQELADVNIDECDHILDFLYHMTVPNSKELRIDIEHETDHDGITEDSGDDGQETPLNPRQLQKVSNFVWPRIFKKITGSNPIAVMIKVPWKIFTLLKNLHGTRVEQVDDNDDQKTPTIEEIAVPSVMELAKAGILFSPVNGGISDISFDVETSTLYLPVVELDVNTEVYLRNLVAYEACVVTGSLVVARYTEFMNGIIDTEEDAKYLRERGIVVNHLKSDKEVVELWNGMSKCVKLTKVKNMDKVIKDVNKRYGETWSVKFSRVMKRYVFASWKLLTLLVAMFLIFLYCVQTFCSMYSCAQVLHELTIIPGLGLADE